MISPLRHNQRWQAQEGLFRIGHVAVRELATEVNITRFVSWYPCSENSLHVTQLSKLFPYSAQPQRIERFDLSD